MQKPKRILFVAPPYFGHTNQVIVLAQELAARGHTVGLASTEMFQDRITNAGIGFLSWAPEQAISDKKLLEKRERLWTVASREPSILRGERMMFEVVAETYVPMYQTLAPLWRDFDPDLAVVDSAVVPALDLAKQFDVPCIIQLQFLGTHLNIDPRYPRYGTAYSIRMNPGQRVLNYFHPFVATLHFWPAIRKLNRARAQCSARTPLRDLYYKNLMLVCSAFPVELPRPLPPLMKMVGPILPRQLEPLSGALSEWLTADTSPVVFMSFGTLATLESWQAKELVAGLTESRFRVLWSLRANQQALLPDLPPTFRVEHFVPQQAVLAHPAVRAFVSHCGMNSVSECLYWGKPILALPIFGDQHYNAARVADCGAALRLRKDRLESAEIRRKIESLLSEPGFSAAALKMSRVLRSTGGLDYAVKIVEDTLVTGIGHLIPEVAYAQAQ